MRWLPIELIEYTRYKNYYVKRTKKGYSLVRRREATIFPKDEAQKFIELTVPLDDQHYFKIIEAEHYTPKKTIVQQAFTPEPTTSKDTVSIITEDIGKYAESKFFSLKRSLENQQEYYDNAIIDILHFIGDKNCRLNAVQLCKVAQKLQELERGHTATKKELKRISTVFDAVTDIRYKADEFGYVPYKPKVLHNIDEIIKWKEWYKWDLKK